MRRTSTLLVCLLSGVALSACSVLGGAGAGGGGSGSSGGTGGTGGGGGSGGTGGTGGTGSSGSTVVPATTTATAVVRKYAIDMSTGGPRYLVGDRSQSGGVSVGVGEIILGGNRYGEIDTPSGGIALETGDRFSGIVAPHRESTVAPNPPGQTVHTYNSTGFIPSTLGISDFSHARGAVGTSLNASIGEAFMVATYGSRDDTRTNNAPAATATYTGRFGAQAIAPDGVSSVTGDLTLTADMGSATVSGMIGTIEVVDQTGNVVTTGVSGIRLDSAAINGTTYAGSVALVDAGGNAVGNFADPVQSGVGGRAEYHGGFYGPNGEETAGAVDMTGQLDGQRLDLLGVFVGSR